MCKIIGTVVGNTAPWKAALAAGGLVAAIAGATPALAWDPQATSAQIDTALSHQAYPSNAYASAPYSSGAYASAAATTTRRSRSDAYASARRNEQPTTTSPAPHKGFQDYK
jgi:hypothetical protein